MLRQGDLSMAIKVNVPAPLRSLTAGEHKIDGKGSNIKEIIDNMELQYQGVKQRICDEQGNVRPFVNIYLNGEDIRHLSEISTEVKDGDEISIVPAVAGG